MKVDIHFTTCHHSSIKCRPRTNDYNLENFNISPWTTEEKFKITKKSLFSLIKFSISGGLGEQPINVIDDGSDYNLVDNWLNLLEGGNLIKAHRFEHRGSSAGLNDYVKTIPEDIDLIVHTEDDHCWFNPENLEWPAICHKFLKDNPDVGVITFRSGLPTNPKHPDYKGAWGPIGWRESRNDSPPAILFRCLGNAHHIMLKETYLKFFPLQGNAGSCEAYMNGKLSQLGLLNAEIQIPVYAFHSHCYEREMPAIVTTDELNMSPRGREYGIKNMVEYLKDEKPITYSYYISPTEEVTKCYP
jgi:hypothetical protein